jgi:hypothetical protein
LETLIDTSCTRELERAGDLESAANYCEEERAERKAKCVDGRRRIGPTNITRELERYGCV